MPVAREVCLESLVFDLAFDNVPDGLESGRGVADELGKGGRAAAAAAAATVSVAVAAGEGRDVRRSV
ncbi:Protein of unknown function [Gryllus bimaculatus]|nr:Protein of unknown function [Gryllus bimaculatus]